MTNKEAIMRMKGLKLKIDQPTINQLGRMETWFYKQDIEAFDMAIEALEQEPKILKVNEKQLEKLKKLIDDNPLCVAIAEQKTGWIPVSERLPEKNGRYLVTRGLNACGAMWNRTYIINYSDLMGLKLERIWWEGNVGKSDFKRIDDVIAWMPLPESYKEG